MIKDQEWMKGRWCKEMFFKYLDMFDIDTVEMVFKEDCGWVCPNSYFMFYGNIKPEFQKEPAHKMVGGLTIGKENKLREGFEVASKKYVLGKQSDMDSWIEKTRARYEKWFDEYKIRIQPPTEDAKC